MKRVQLILEEWHHDWLTEKAKLRGKTMSGLARELLTEAIEHRKAETWQDDPIWGIVGLGEGPDDGINSENLDKYLYPSITSKPLREENTNARTNRKKQNKYLYQPVTPKPLLRMAEDGIEYNSGQ